MWMKVVDGPESRIKWKGGEERRLWKETQRQTAKIKVHLEKVWKPKAVDIHKKCIRI